MRRHRDKKVANPGCIKLGRFKPDINEEYEVQLVIKIQSMEKPLFGLTTKDLRRLAFDFATQMNIQHRFNTEIRMAGYDWLCGFLSRHPELSIRKPEVTNIARAVGFNKAQLQKFFEIHRSLLTRDEYTPMQVWNMDETGITNLHKLGNIIASKGSKSVGKITSGEKGRTVTVICASNAAGGYIPPMIIFPRKRMVDSLMHNAPVGAIGHCSNSGWTDVESFMKWLKYFTSIAKPCKEKKHIIILDGHYSHKTLEAVEFSLSNGIELLTLPPHCTHKMQPLDKTFFKPLKTAYNAAADTWMVAHRGKKISFYEIAEIFAVAYNRTATVEKSVNGLRACGLLPFNDCIFSDDDYVEVATEEQECSRQAVSSQSDMSSHALLEDQRSPRSLENEQLVGDQEAQQSQRTEENQALDGHHDVQQSQRLQEHQEVNGRQEVLQSREITLQRDVPSTSSLSESARKTKRFLFQLCTPSQDTSSAKPRRGSTRVSEQSQHVTLSPYKKLLKEKNQRKKHFSATKKTTVTRKAVGKKKQELCY